MEIMVSSSPYLAAPPAFNVIKYVALIPINDDDWVWQMKLDHVMCLVLGAGFLGVLVVMVTLILKLWVNLINSGVEQGLTVETEFLLPKQVVSFTYGTYDDEGDVESGKGSCTSSTEDLYDWKICVICYDQDKCCFFVPCGHCVACETCAKRIIVGENKTCPICRRLIRRVKRVLMS